MILNYEYKAFENCFWGYFRRDLWFKSCGELGIIGLFGIVWWISQDYYMDCTFELWGILTDWNQTFRNLRSLKQGTEISFLISSQLTSIASTFGLKF